MSVLHRWQWKGVCVSLAMRIALWGLLALTTFLALSGCGPMFYGGSGAKQTEKFVVVVHNLDVAYPATATITWWSASTVTGTQQQLMPPGGEAVFALPGDTPDGFQLVTTAWPAGAVWGGPDYARRRIFHVDYPTLFAWGEEDR